MNLTWKTVSCRGSLSGEVDEETLKELEGIGPLESFSHLAPKYQTFKLDICCHSSK